MNAPRLTANRLSDLAEVIKHLDIEIGGLEQSIPTYPKDSWIRGQLLTRYNKLLGGRNFIAGLITKEKS